VIKNEDFPFEFYPKEPLHELFDTLYINTIEKTKRFFADFEMNLFFNTYNPDLEISIQKES
jgi:hypothetical protein